MDKVRVFWCPLLVVKRRHHCGVLQKNIVTKENENAPMKEQKKPKSGHIRLPYRCGMVL